MLVFLCFIAELTVTASLVYNMHLNVYNIQFRKFQVAFLSDLGVLISFRLFYNSLDFFDGSAGVSHC